MDKKHPNTFPPNQQPLQPYQLIPILNKKIKSQTQSIEWYKKMYSTAEYEKNITLNQLKKKKEIIENLKAQCNQQKEQKRDYQIQLQHLRTRINKLQKSSTSPNTQKHLPIPSIPSLKQSSLYSPYSANNFSKQFISMHKHITTEKPVSTQLSLQLKSSDVYNFFSNPISRVLEEKNVNFRQSEEFVPCDVKLFSGTHKYSFANSSSFLLNVSADLASQTIDEPISQKPAEFFVQDLLVFGPDLSDLKKKRDQDRGLQSLQVKPAIFYASNHKPHNQHVYTEIAMRCFPFNATAKRQFVESYKELKQLIEFIPHNGISKDCMILNLKGQPSPTAKHNQCFKRSNLSEMQFIICLKVPDFVVMAKDQRHYQRKESEIWLVDKYYAIVSYYPFFDIHLNILTKIHSILLQQKLHKILVQKENFLAFDIRRNILQLQKSQQAKHIVEYFKSYSPKLKDVLFFKGHYFGSMPDEDEAQCYIAKLTAPIFMTNFCFQEMLLLLIGVFCQKSIAFISKNEGIATLCALFLIGIMSPFPYSFSVMLNVDEHKIAPFIFEFPFPMISTIKKTSQNIHQVVSAYATARIQKKNIKQEAQRMIFVDIDTNSIFYQGHQSFQPLIFMGHPGQDFMHEYSKVNSSYSKSFSFPKKMDARKQTQQFNKRQQQLSKIVEDIQQTIKSNTMKQPSFHPTEQIQRTFVMLHEYVKSFAVEGRELQEALKELRSNGYHVVLKRCLLEKYPTKGELIERFVNSQYYADYLNLYTEQ